MNRVGIFSGVFDPIHNGHISFAMAAAETANLDKVFFLVEARPRRKKDVSHTVHRLAMLKLALKAHPKLKLLELPDTQMSVAKTLPRLKQRFVDTRLVYLAGADMLEHMPDWSLIERMLEEMDLVIGSKGGLSTAQIDSLIKKLPQQPAEIFIIESPRPNISSKNIRQSLLSGKTAAGLPNSVQTYIKQHWLYAAPSGSISST